MSYEALYTGFTSALLLMGIVVLFRNLSHIAKWAFADIIDSLDKNQEDFSIDEIANFDDDSYDDEDEDFTIESIVFMPES